MFKKTRLDEDGKDNSDNIDATKPAINENIPQNITENVPGNENIIKKLSEVQATVLKSIEYLKQDLIKTNKDKNDDECEYLSYCISKYIMSFNYKYLI